MNIKNSIYKSKLKKINIQLQLGRCPLSIIDRAFDNLIKFSNNSELVNSFQASDKKEEDYVNILLSTNRLRDLWRVLKEYIYDPDEIDPLILSSLIVVCEGDNGWDDYLLLYHYDGSEIVDDITIE